MSANLSRRAALTGIALAGGVALAPVAIASLPAATGPDRAAWDAKLRAYEQADAEVKSLSAAWEAAYERYEAARPDMAEVIDWNQLGISYVARRDHTARVIDVELEWKRYLAGEGKWWWGGADPEGCKARQRKALDSVLEFRRLEAKASADTGYDAISDKEEAASARRSKIENELLMHPAPDQTALLWKLEFLYGGDNDEEGGFAPSWCDRWVNAVMADARRLLSQGMA